MSYSTASTAGCRRRASSSCISLFTEMYLICLKTRTAADWMSRYFFSGGMMPSDDLPLFFQNRLKIEKRWRWDGTHYQKTAEAWLRNLDSNREQVWPILQQTYGNRFCQNVVHALAHVFPRRSRTFWLPRWQRMVCQPLSFQ